MENKILDKKGVTRLLLSKKLKVKIGVGIILMSSCLMINYHHNQLTIKRGYQRYLNQEFNKDLKIREFIFNEEFTIPLITYKNNEKRKKIDELERQQQLQKQRLEKEKQKDSLSRNNNSQELTFILTFYSSQNSENGYGPITCRGKKLVDGIAANNILPLGTRINLKGYGEIVIADRGSSNFNTQERLDVFVPKLREENDEEYSNRVNKMGIVKVKGYIIK